MLAQQDRSRSPIRTLVSLFAAVGSSMILLLGMMSMISARRRLTAADTFGALTSDRRAKTATCSKCKGKCSTCDGTGTETIVSDNAIAHVTKNDVDYMVNANDILELVIKSYPALPKTLHYQKHDFNRVELKQKSGSDYSSVKDCNFTFSEAQHAKSFIAYLEAKGITAAEPKDDDFEPKDDDSVCIPFRKLNAIKIEMNASDILKLVDEKWFESYQVGKTLHYRIKYDENRVELYDDNSVKDCNFTFPGGKHAKPFIAYLEAKGIFKES